MNFDGWFEWDSKRVDLAAFIRSAAAIESRYDGVPADEATDKRLQDYNKVLVKSGLDIQNTFLLDRLVTAAFEKWGEVRRFFYPESVVSQDSADSKSTPSPTSPTGSGS